MRAPGGKKILCYFVTSWSACTCGKNVSLFPKVLICVQMGERKNFGISLPLDLLADAGKKELQYFVSSWSACTCPLYSLNIHSFKQALFLCFFFLFLISCFMFLCVLDNTRAGIVQALAAVFLYQISWTNITILLTLRGRASQEPLVNSYARSIIAIGLAEIGTPLWRLVNAISLWIWWFRCQFRHPACFLMFSSEIWIVQSVRWWVCAHLGYTALWRYTPGTDDGCLIIWVTLSFGDTHHELTMGVCSFRLYCIVEIQTSNWWWMFDHLSYTVLWRYTPRTDDGCVLIWVILHCGDTHHELMIGVCSFGLYCFVKIHTTNWWWVCPHLGYTALWRYTPRTDDGCVLTWVILHCGDTNHELMMGVSSFGLYCIVEIRTTNRWWVCAHLSYTVLWRYKPRTDDGCVLIWVMHRLRELHTTNGSSVNIHHGADYYMLPALYRTRVGLGYRANWVKLRSPDCIRYLI